MIVTTLTVSDLVEEALGHLYRTAERPKPVTLDDGLTDAVDTSLTLLTAADWNVVQATDVLEFGSELVYVSTKTDDPIPVFTVVRGYEATTAAAHTGIGLLNPAWPRYKVFNNIRDWFRRSNAALPLVVVETLQVETNRQNVVMPARVLDVYEVGYENPSSGAFFGLDGWNFVRASGTLVAPTYVANGDALTISYQKAYTVPTTEADEVDIPLGGEICPALYAAAFLASKGEVSRLELNNATEWQKLEVIRNGQNLGITRDMWQQYYRALDDAKRTQQPPRHRRFQKARRFI